MGVSQVRFIEGRDCANTWDSDRLAAFPKGVDINLKKAEERQDRCPFDVNIPSVEKGKRK